jgi:thiol reductant ABC exporter CydC subunit
MSICVRLLRLLSPLRWWIALAMLLYFLTIGAGVGLMAAAAYLISKAALSTGFADLAVLVTAVRTFAISRAALRYGERYISHSTTFRILTRLQVWLYSAIEPIAPAGLQRFGSGDLLTRMAADVDTLDQFYIRAVAPPVAAALTCILASVLMGVFALQLGVTIFAFLLLTGLVLPLVTQRMSRKPASEFIQARADLNALLADGIDGLADRMAFGRAGEFNVRSLRLGEALDRAQMRVASLRGLTNGLAGLFTGLAALTILLLAIPLVSHGHIDGVFLAVVPLTAIACFEAVQPLSAAVQELERSQVAAARLFELIDTPPSRVEPDLPAVPNMHAGIEFDRVSFRYAALEPNVLEEFSLRLPSGGRIGLTGVSGSGKSTLVSLLAGFRQAQSGTLRIFGNDTSAYRDEDLRNLLGVVPQQIYLFNGTIRDNLLLAKGDATDEEIAEACRKAQIHDFIASLPSGYATLVGENGFKLSGGERQRLAIARALLKAAPILILDEATSHLDVETERNVLSALDLFMRGRTTLVIAHRSAALSLAGDVYTLPEARQEIPRQPAGTELQVSLPA